MFHSYEWNITKSAQLSTLLRAPAAEHDDELKEADGGAEEAAHEDQLELVLFEDRAQHALELGVRELLHRGAQRLLEAERLGRVVVAVRDVQRQLLAEVECKVSDQP